MTTFENPDYDEMVLQVGIPMQSVCEHHLLPFIGKVSIAYIPHSYGGQIVGLSKLARIVDWLSARPQTQERLSEQIATFLYTELNANGVGVLIKSEHLCMTVRGVRAHGTHTVTSKLLGAFKDDPATRAEFLRLATEH